MVFGAVALVLCQSRVPPARPTGISLAVFAVAFVVRAVGESRAEARCPGCRPSPGRSRRAPSWTCGGPGPADQWHGTSLLRLGPSSPRAVTSTPALFHPRVAPTPARPAGPDLARLAAPTRRTAGGRRAGSSHHVVRVGRRPPGIHDMAVSPRARQPAVAAIFGDNPDQFTLGFLGVLMLYGAAACAAYAIVMGHAAKGEESAWSRRGHARPARRTHALARRGKPSSPAWGPQPSSP